VTNELNLFNLNEDEQNVYTPSRLNGEIKIILENNYPVIKLTGEISGYKKYSSGHAYFYLKDDGAQVNAVMFSAGNILRFIPKDGMQVTVTGRVSAYPKRGDYQIIVNSMRETGAGELLKQFELLKAKLEKEGLFDASAKRPLPKIINKAGIITSKDGAALHDILAVFKKYNANFEVIIYPVKVQGDEAKFEIAQAIEFLNKNYPDIDVLLIGRGGGSSEDLWAFNEEIVARSIYNSKIFTISCVGHETDYTIADMVADFRAATPTYAAETVAQINDSLKNNLQTYYKTLFDEIDSKITFLTQNLERFERSRALTKPHLIYEDSLRYIDDLSVRAQSAFNKLYNLKKIKFDNARAALNMVSPLNVIKRGYSIISAGGIIVKNKNQVKAGDSLNIKVSDGNFNARVE
jgi:exodeoxyribonuclease VII large subunit